MDGNWTLYEIYFKGGYVGAVDKKSDAEKSIDSFVQVGYKRKDFTIRQIDG